jgi:phosphatidylethanolamine-binding protein (PEBP) family uncharacterized protein
LAAVLSLAVSCGPDDGRELADPDPDLTAVPVATTSPAAIVDLDPELQATGPGGLTLSSPDFSPGATMPEDSACGGATSPALTWTAAPRRTRQLALVVQDIDSDGTIHWLVTDIPPDSLSVDRGIPPVGGEVRPNSRGTATWASPCPQDGFAHRIVFTLYALDRRLPETSDDAASVVAAIRDVAFGSATLLGRAAPGAQPG